MGICHVKDLGETVTTIASKSVYGANVTGHALFPLCRPRLFIMAQSHQFTHESGRIKGGHWEDARRTIGADLVIGPCNRPCHSLHEDEPSFSGNICDPFEAIALPGI